MKMPNTQKHLPLLHRLFPGVTEFKLGEQHTRKILVLDDVRCGMKDYLHGPAEATLGTTTVEHGGMWSQPEIGLVISGVGKLDHLDWLEEDCGVYKATFRFVHTYNGYRLGSFEQVVRFRLAEKQLTLC